ncbi:MAG: hypothetical protein ACJ77I_12540 [Chloroflexota bacterium]
MSERSDIDHVVRHWMSDGPSTMPDRVVDAVADRISRQPQRRTWRLVRRLPMNPILKLGAAVAAALIIAVVGWNLFPGQPGSGSLPSPSLSPSTSPSPSPTLGASIAPTATPEAVRCEDDLPGCAGPLEAGAHGSSLFAPRLIHYVTPAGWTNSIDTPSIYKLDAPDGRTSILLWTDVSIEDQTPTSCEPVARAGGVTPSATAWISYLTSHPGLVTTTPVKADFPGRTEQNGQSIDIAIDPGWTQTCPGRSEPVVQFLAHPGTPASVYGVGSTGKVHLVVVDTTSYGPRTVVIEVYGPSDDTAFADVVDLARDVMDTFVFGCGPGTGYGPCSGYPQPSLAPVP